MVDSYADFGTLLLNRNMTMDYEQGWGDSSWMHVFFLCKSESGTGEMVGGLIGVVLGMCVRFTCELS